MPDVTLQTDELPLQLDPATSKSIEKRALPADQPLRNVKVEAQRLIANKKKDLSAPPAMIDDVIESLKLEKDPCTEPQPIMLFELLDKARECVAWCHDATCAKAFRGEPEIEFQTVNDRVLLALVLVMLFRAPALHDTKIRYEPDSPTTDVKITFECSLAGIPSESIEALRDHRIDVRESAASAPVACLTLPLK